MLTALIAITGLALACTRVPAPPDLEGAESEFSVRLVAAHLEALSRLTPRWPDSREDRLARRYLDRAFQAAGARVLEGLDAGGPFVAEVAGRSEDLVLLVAPYPALGSARWVDDAGVALLLELARLQASERPLYTVRFALAEVRPEAAGAVDRTKSGWRVVRDASEARRRVVFAGRALAAAFASKQAKGALRAVVTFEPRAEAGARLARDLRSHPVFREIFWETAARLGHANAFPEDAGWSSAPGLHGAFRELAEERVLSLVDERVARAELADGAGAPVPRSAEALEPLGRVTRTALSDLMSRFHKIDFFAP